VRLPGKLVAWNAIQNALGGLCFLIEFHHDRVCNSHKYSFSFHDFEKLPRIFCCRPYWLSQLEHERAGFPQHEGIPASSDWSVLLFASDCGDFSALPLAQLGGDQSVRPPVDTVPAAIRARFAMGMGTWPFSLNGG
jgi:hypothetical protein